MPSLKVYFGRVWLEMLPEDYLVGLDGEGEMCGLCVLPSGVEVGGEEYWVLGANFLRGFYTVFDIDQAQLGFAPLLDSPKDAPCDEICAGGFPTKPAPAHKNPENDDDKTITTPNYDLPWYIWLIIALIILVGIIVLIVIFCSGTRE